jgi:hypothetical protein
MVSGWDGNNQLSDIASKGDQDVVACDGVAA